MPQPVATWDGEDPVIWSFTVLRDPVVCPAAALRTPSGAWGLSPFPRTGTNRKGQASPLRRWRYNCVSSSPVLPGSLHISHIVSHDCCCITIRYHCSPISPLSQGLFFQDCSIWQHWNLWAEYRMQNQTKWLLVDRELIDGVMHLPLDFLSYGCDAKKQENSPDMLLLPAPSKTLVPSSNLSMFPCWI